MFGKGSDKITRHAEILTFWKKYRKGNDKITRHAERSKASPLFWETPRKDRGRLSFVRVTYISVNGNRHPE